jgi:hypothetical protein
MLDQNITETIIERKFFIVCNLRIAFFWGMRVNELQNPGIWRKQSVLIFKGRSVRNKLGVSE